MSYSYQGITSVSVRGTGISEDEPVTTSIHGPDKPCQRYCHLTFNTIVRALCVLIFLGCIGFCGLLLYFSWYPLNIKLEAALTVGASSFDEFGRYVMNNFDDAKPTANFLAGLGGIWGTPMWAFYVNKGQGITAFGVQNKDGAIAKFNTAEKAYQQTPFTGFRTFVKGKRGVGGESFEHMPFFPNGPATGKLKPVRTMKIGMNEMEIKETATEYGLQTNVLYFTVPGESFAALVRKVTFTNLDSRSGSPLTLDVLDGLGKVQPSGISNLNLDAIGRTMEAWMNVYNVASDGEVREPFFHISQDTGDTAQVQIIKSGHFAIAFIEDDDDSNSDLNSLHTPLPFIVDPSVVFDVDTSLMNPSGFFGTGSPLAEDISKQPQGTTSKTPCAFAAATLTIPPGGSVTITSIYGHADNLQTFTSSYSPLLRSKGFVSSKRLAASELVDSITDKVLTSTGSYLFDSYIKQNFLDNTLRGGLPLSLGDAANRRIYHTYSRIHGDLERDYNSFQFEAGFFSQGPGNFRDVTQNRRMDVMLSPEVGDFNVRMFLSLIQADSYNPLTVATTNFKIPSQSVPSVMNSVQYVNGADNTSMSKILSKSFRIGSLFSDIKAAGIILNTPKEEFLKKVVTAAKQDFAGQFSQNGFWADHWTYILDLVDNYISVFPDKEAALLWDSEPVPFFMSPAIVKDRTDRYTLVADPLNKGQFNVRVYSAISVVGEQSFPADRAWALQQIYSSPDFIADASGAGGVWQRNAQQVTYRVSIISKLSMLGILKFSTLDPMGMGVEMEGGKPGWNDAMNGLPGLIGSGMAETYEMLRIIRYVKAALMRHERAVQYPEEFSDFMIALAHALEVHEGSSGSQRDNHLYWDATNNAREMYRHKVSVTFSGITIEVPSDRLILLLTAMEKKTNDGITRALQSTGGLSPSYFHYECVDYEVIPSKKNGTLPTAPRAAPLPPIVEIPKISCREFTTQSLPIFLEGPVRHMKILRSHDDRLAVYRATKDSDIYDPFLKMYRLSESLQDMRQDVGRMKAFTPGWLENQSIWLHMSYKFYLELLRGGLYSEFFEEISTGLVPFMNNTMYGRSPLEAASFIVSSVFPDKKLHGSSFLARLTGSTAEMMSIWSIMMAGHRPFILDTKGTLMLSLKPILPGWLFTENGTVSFKFLSDVLVTYHNPARLDSWTLESKSIKVVYKDGISSEFLGGPISAEVAESVRGLSVRSIDVYY